MDDKPDSRSWVVSYLPLDLGGVRDVAVAEQRIDSVWPTDRVK